MCIYIHNREYIAIHFFAGAPMSSGAVSGGATSGAVCPAGPEPENREISMENQWKIIVSIIGLT